MYFPTNLINFATLHLKGWTNRGKLWGLIYLAHSAYYIQIEIKASILILGSFLDFTFSLKSCSKYRAKPVSRRRGVCIRLWSSATFSRHHLLPSMSEKKSETKNVSLTLNSKGLNSLPRHPSFGEIFKLWELAAEENYIPY